MPVQIDWESTSADQRALLNRPLIVLRKRLGLSWQDLFLEAFGPRNRVSDRYQDNLSRGRIAPQRAFMLHGWIARHDPVLAAETERSLLHSLQSTEVPGSAWNRYIEQNGVFNSVAAFAFRPSFGISEFSRGVQLPGLELALGEDYFFEVNAARSGKLGCIVRHRDVWYLIPLSRFSSFLNCEAGTNAVPWNSDLDEIDPLVEREDRGLHEFVFLNLSSAANLMSMLSWEPRKPIPTHALNEATQELLAIEENDISMFRINLLVS